MTLFAISASSLTSKCIGEGKKMARPTLAARLRLQGMDRVRAAWLGGMTRLLLRP